MRHIIRTGLIALLIMALLMAAGVAEDVDQVSSPMLEPAPQELGEVLLTGPEEDAPGGLAVQAASGDVMKSAAGSNAGLPENLKLGLGEAVMLKAKAGGETVTFKTSNGKVVRVKLSGKTKGLKKGKATVTVVKSDGTVVGACRVQVLNAPDSIVLPVFYKLKMSSKSKLKVKLPANTASKITWSSDKKSVAKVDQNGVVTGVKPGTANITAETFNGKKASCKVTVVSPDPTEVAFTEEKIAIGKDETVAVKPVVNEGAEAVYTWTSKDKSVASVDKDGNITGKGIGTTVITAETQNGLKAKLKLRVAKKPASVKLDGSATVEAGKKVKLNARVSSGSASYNLAWRSADRSIATVNSKGVVTGVKPGKTKITVTTFNGRKAACAVEVTKGGTDPDAGGTGAIHVYFGDTEVQDSIVVNRDDLLNISWEIVGDLTAGTLEIVDPAGNTIIYQDVAAKGSLRLDEYTLAEGGAYKLLMQAEPRSGAVSGIVRRKVSFKYVHPLNKKFRSFVSDSRWKPGTAWSGMQQPRFANPRNMYYGCAALCADFSSYCYGMDDPVDGEEFTDLREARLGDVITMGDPSDGTGHWYCVLDRQDDHLFVVEGNTDEMIRVGWHFTIDDDPANNPEVWGHHLAQG